MIKININEKSYEVDGKLTILEACQSVGIDVPTLCHLKGEIPDGSCRICIVDVSNGYKNGLVASCTEGLKEGMSILTNSDKVREARRFLLDLLLSDHDTNCFACTKNGVCELQQLAIEYGIDRTSFEGKKLQIFAPDSSNPFHEYDPGRCILCTRCTRVCDLKQGRFAQGILGRGHATKIGPGFEINRDDSNCESCGNCVSACPTGALFAKNQRSYRMWEVSRTRTTCPHCGVGCQMDLLVKNNRVVGVEPADGPSNKGMLCVKGKYASYRFINSLDRLTHPLIKRNGVFEKAGWDETLTLITEKFSAIKEKYGGDALAGFSCSRAPNEDNYLFQKMVRTVFGTNNVDNCARLCHSASVHGLNITLGSGAMTNPIADITTDIDVILLVGSNPTEAHPVIGARIRRAVREGTKLIVVDPRCIDIVDIATLHLPIKAGTNVAFANGMLHIIIRDELCDMEFIKTRTEGFDDVREAVAEYTPEKVAEICGINANDLEQAAHMYAKAKKAPIIYCLGVTEHSTGTVGVMTLSNLAMAVGKIGKSGCGINPLRGQNNVQGACDMGCLPSVFPGYQQVANPQTIEKFEKVWKTTLNPQVGLTSTQVLNAAGQGKIKALYIFGEDPMVVDPDIREVHENLSNLDFLVVHDLFLTETAKLADVVLPGVCYAEKEGTVANTERRIQRIRKAVEAPGEARPETEVFCEIMTRMGYPISYTNPEEIMQEIATVSPHYQGISFKRLDAGETLQWPCLNETDKGVYYLHKDKFTRGFGLFYPAKYIPARELPDDDYPLALVTGRMLYHYNTGAMTRRTEGIMELAGESYVEISYADAAELGVKDGERVKVTSRRGEIETNARVGDVVKTGEVFMTFHYPDANANWLTNPVFDDIANIPEYKVCAVKVDRIS